jgi:3-isopropylmalate/(R)-2-methylmalate dehydratase large subunit
MVPQTLKVNLHGGFAPGVHPRDLGFLLSADLTSGKAGVEYDYRVVEFAGAAVTDMNLASRIALCNTLTEIGVINTLFPPMSPLGAARDPSWVESDADAVFENVLDIDLGSVQPQVALPGGPDRAADIGTVVGRRIDHAYLGACGSSMYDDFKTAADLLKGQKVAPNVRLFMVPGTVALAKRLADEGLTQLFMDAGAIMLPPGCGPCAGGVGGPMGPGEVSISTAATNGPGRMGDRTSECYLGSPPTVIASAVRGCIVDPRSVLLAA